MPNDQRVAVVTGAGTGIGRRTAETLADAGYAVAALGRRPEKLSGFSTRGTILPCPCDVTSTGDVARAASVISAELGTVSGLVNAAGTIIEQDIDDLTLDAVRAQFATNVEGTLIPILEFLGDLRLSGGSIVNFSSMLTRRPLPKSAGYTATKGAIEALTRVLAMELAADKIRVNVVLPSLVRSDIYIDAGMPPGEYAAMLDDLSGIFPLGRVGEPDDVAGIVRFLLSDESSWMTGTSINVDGGRGIG